MTVKEPGIMELAWSKPLTRGVTHKPDQFRIVAPGLAWGDERWSLPVNILSPFYPYRYRAAQDVTMVVIHHSAGAPTGTARQFAAYHAAQGGKNWPGIGYHFVVKPGRIVYAGDILTIRYHSGPGNLHGIGICCPGNFEREKPSAELLATLRLLIARLSEHVGHALEVKAHRDLMSTACPGRFMLERWSDLLPSLLPTEVTESDQAGK